MITTLLAFTVYATPICKPPTRRIVYGCPQFTEYVGTFTSRKAAVQAADEAAGHRMRFASVKLDDGAEAQLVAKYDGLRYTVTETE